MFKFVLPLLFIFSVADSWAQQEMTFGIESAAFTNNRFLANPPLPMSFMKKGRWELTVQPASFDGELDRPHPGQGSANETGQFEGFGGGLSFSYSFKDKWSYYVLGSGMTVKGNFQFRQQNCGGAGNICRDTDSNKSVSKFYTLSGGVNYQFWGKDENSFALPVFLGPYLNFVSTSQTVTERRDGTLNTDFDMEADAIFVGLMLGAQARIPLGKKFVLKPFAIFGSLINNECKTYKVTDIRKTDTQNPIGGNPELYYQSTPDCSNASGPTSGQQFQFLDSSSFAVAGMSASYTPWHLTLNVTAPIIDLLSGSDDPDVKIFTLSYTFRN